MRKIKEKRSYTTHSSFDRIRRILLRSVLFTVGAVAVVSAYKYYDVGSNENISLQCPVSSITAADLSAARAGNLSPTPSADNADETDESQTAVPTVTPVSVRRVSYFELKPRVKSDSGALSRNTYNVTASENDLGIPDELVDVSTFTYDGHPYWTNVTLANVRSGPGIDNDIVCSLPADSRVVRISYGSEWSYIRMEDHSTGYILTSLLTDIEPEEEPEATPTPTVTPKPAEPTVPAETPTPVPTNTPAPTATPMPSYTESEHVATVYASCELNVRTGPGTDCSLVTVLSPRQSFDAVALTSNGWYRSSDGLYVKAELTWDVLPEPTAAPAPVETPEDTNGEGETNTDGTVSESETDTESEEPNNEGGEETSVSYSDFASYCLQFVGTPYEYGRASPSAFDCSGFVSYTYANYYGISLPHNAAEIAEMGTAVDSGSVECGDVLCHDYNSDGYIDHVSLYIGNGTCIHASNSRQGVITSAYPMGSVVTIRRFL